MFLNTGKYVLHELVQHGSALGLGVSSALPRLGIKAGRRQQEVEEGAPDPAVLPRFLALQLEAAEHVGRGLEVVGYLANKRLVVGVLEPLEAVAGPAQDEHDCIPRPGLRITVRYHLVNKQFVS